MIALQYFDCPGYKGLIIRRSLTDLKLPSSILARAKEWLAPWIQSGEVRWVPSEHAFYSMEGGMLQFGYMDKEDSVLRYQGAEFQTICVDEGTQLRWDDIMYLHSRLRRLKNQNIPVRFRIATNPGGRSHADIKNYFGIEKNEEGMFVGTNSLRPFIHAKVRDNPFLEVEQYERQLDKLDPLTRDRLKNGDWSASEAAIYKDAWFDNRWKKKGEYYQLESKGRLRTYHESEIFVFGTTDVAGSERTGVEGRTFFKNQEKSYSVLAIWGMTPDFELMWLCNYRYQCTIPNFIHYTVEACQQWKPVLIGAEGNSINIGFVQGARSRGLQIVDVPSVPDKIVRSTSAQLLAEEGHVWLPAYAEWLGALEDELFIWEGVKGQTDDQIDVLSLAGNYVAHKRYGMDMSKGLTDGKWAVRPSSTAGLFGPQLATLGPRGARQGLYPVRKRTG